MLELRGPSESRGMLILGDLKQIAFEKNKGLTLSKIQWPRFGQLVIGNLSGNWIENCC